MSVKEYPLRNCTKTGATNRSSLRSASQSPSRSIDIDPDVRTPGPRTEVGDRLYSDVATLRPSSPLLGKGNVRSNHVATGLENFVKEAPPHVSNNRMNGLFTNSDSDRDDGADSKAPWTVVQRKHKGSAKRSLSDNDRDELSTKLFEQPQKLSEDQIAAVAKAAESLTKKEKEKISRRNKKVKASTRHRRDSSASSHGEGPADPKGKGIDPRNWGGLQLDDAEADVELQAAALKTFKSAQRQEMNIGAKVLPPIIPIPLNDMIVFRVCIVVIVSL